MPVIHVEMWAGRTESQKAELARAFTDAMVKTIQTTPEGVTIIFRDVPKEDWAQAGRLSSQSGS